MSAINVFVGREVAYVYSDGAFFDRSGMLLGLDTKVFPLMNHVAVVGAVGHSFIPRIVEAVLAEANFDFDQLTEKFGELVRDAERRFMPTSPVQWERYRAALVGWSPKLNRPVCVTAKSYDDGEVPAFTSIPVTEYVDPFISMPLAPTVANHGFDFSTPCASGLSLVTRQRSTLWADGISDRTGTTPIYGVGGFCQQTKITRDAIEMRILHRWAEDQVGKRISPTRNGFFG
jgi:hypothetical protein